MFKTALVKLIFWYVSLIMVLSLAFSVVLYHFSSSELKEGLDKQYKSLIINDHDNTSQYEASLNQYQQRAEDLLLDFIYFNVVVFIGSLVIGYLLAKQTLKPIEKAHMAQVRFTAQASHALRTPLTAIRADSESVLMLANNDNKLLLSTLRANLRDVQKLEQLTNRLLELARNQATLSLHLETVDIGKIINQAVKQIKRTQNGKNRIVVNDQQIKAMVKGDPLSLELLFITLLDNAVKYSPKNSTIELNLSLQSKKLIINIINQGQSINNQDLAYAFEPFYRSEKTSHNKLAGYGLGLAIAKQIVEGHHGKIYIKNDSTKKVIVVSLLLSAI